MTWGQTLPSSPTTTKSSPSDPMTTSRANQVRYHPTIYTMPSTGDQLPAGEQLKMDETEARYTHLLQPIRDMTKNWEVDVAAQLGEYMHELDQICISFDGGKTTMNFAEAALLIQGSACIYSKKFLSLDDINGTNKSNMDMRKNNSPNVVDIVPLTPMGLVPPEEAEKKDNPLYSRKGEILASCKDFRINTYTPHTNGAFVLDLAGMSPIREFLREGNNRNASVLDVGPGDENGNLQAGTSNNEAPLPILNFSDPGGAGDNDCDDDDNVGDALPPLAEGNRMEVDPSPSEHVERHQAVNDRYMLRERAIAPAETEKAKGTLFSNEIAEHQNKDLENAEEQNEIEDNRHDDYLDNDGGDDFSDHENLAQDFPAEILDEEGLAATGERLHSEDR
ncbi:Condensin-2 complex subunit H2 [Acipenser ruthenus]|uniref:Condensin-2 complex subunit H2 n=1 Tax=Acipenser ruthenus TaxID=7906 RepID=A0A444TZI6_ACIRT|nr:Condensin-2 complex subunit H2 [Acipenser ruthenus]